MILNVLSHKMEKRSKSSHLSWKEESLCWDNKKEYCWYIAIRFVLLSVMGIGLKTPVRQPLSSPSLQSSVCLLSQCANSILDENAVYTECQNTAALSIHMFSCLFIPEITHYLSKWRGWLSVSRDGEKPAHIQLWYQQPEPQMELWSRQRSTSFQSEPVCSQ